MLRVQRFQSCARDVGINLRGRNIGVAKQQLDNSQIGAVIQQVRGERMTQSMRRQRRVDRGACTVALDQYPKHLATHRMRALRDEVAADLDAPEERPKKRAGKR